MKRNSGFTLIELVIVIVILGILAVTAAPKFVDIQDDARQAAAEGVQGAIKSSVSAIHAKALIESKDASSGESVNASGTDVDLAYGYPDGTADGIRAAVELDGDWATNSAAGVSSGTKTFIFTDGTLCFTYTEASESNNVITAPTVSAIGSTFTAGTPATCT
ncbi:type II secretion system protein [Catenovulum sp. SM1970]|uniref:type II secretion system protein n=1 Tax=Marinifaba aquimaris TaxID=2741323 RepID=UPI0015747B3B|nr:type II secretion system protein [Marinifaba aquimaris]NTS75866.1 type II secretion system protein [Marinifaba aquimaris]